MWPDDCVATALVQNEWLQQEQVQSMGELDLKAALIENLKKNLDEEIHSVPELSFRLELLSDFNTIHYILGKNLTRKVAYVVWPLCIKL